MEKQRVKMNSLLIRISHPNNMLTIVPGELLINITYVDMTQNLFTSILNFKHILKKCAIHYNYQRNN